MASEKYDLEIEQGATYSFSVTRADSEGTPINFTGYTAKMQIRVDQGAAPLLDATTENGKISIPVGTDGKIYVNLSGTDTAKLRFSKMKYDLKVIGPGGSNQVRIIRGDVFVIPEITQEPGDPVVVRA